MKDKKDDGALLLQEAIVQSYERASTYLGIYYFFVKSMILLERVLIKPITVSSEMHHIVLPI